MTLIQKIAKGNDTRMQILTASCDDMPFADWLNFLNGAFWAEFGLFLEDMPDLLAVRDLYDDGMSIFDALTCAVDEHLTDDEEFAKLVSLTPNWREEYSSIC